MNTTVSFLFLTLLIVTVTSSWTGAYLGLGKTCDPKEQNNGVAEGKYEGKVCFPGSVCNPQLKICDCADSDDGLWKRTFEKGDCRLLPGSKCVRNVDQDFYRCVENSQCSQTRVGKDGDGSRCPADAPCDVGDYNCVCPTGKTCLSAKVPATSS